MNRTNIILNQALVLKAKNLSGEKTIRGTVHFALAYFVNDAGRKEKIDQFRQLKGSGTWEGDLKKTRKSRI